jgi:hypothetical protein
VILKCFFDGGNKSDSRVYDYATLAVAGTFHEWKPFEKAWKRNLDKHHAPYLHTTDAAVGNSPFSRDEGWDRQTIDAFVMDCARIVGKYIARPITTSDSGRPGLYAYVVTINLKDYLRARNEVVIPPSPDQDLATATINACFIYGKQFAGTKYLSLVYDQNEPFRGYILDRQHNPKATKMWPEFADIISNTEENSRFVPALQFADLLAYCYCNKRERGVKFEWERKMLSHPIEEGYADYPVLVNPNREAILATEAMKFPRRTAMR